MTDGNNETRRRRADDPDRLHVGLELGRASLSDVPTNDERVGRYRQLGGRKLARRQGAVHLAAGARQSAGARAVLDVPVDRYAGMVGENLADVFDRRGAHVSGREIRVAKYVVPLWEIELNYDLLRMVSPNTELQEIIGFFEQSQGAEASFYFEPPPLSPVAGQAIGTGDGATTTFPFVVSIGGATVSPANVGTVSAVYLNGVAQSSGSYTVNDTALAPTVTFATAPASAVAVTADFHWFFLCRFDDDSEDVEEFMSAALCAAVAQAAHGAVMTTPPSLPTLAGLTWSRHKKPGFSTRVASHVSGREVRVALMSYPLYEFEAVYSGLASSDCRLCRPRCDAVCRASWASSCSCRGNSARSSTPIPTTTRSPGRPSRPGMARPPRSR